MAESLRTVRDVEPTLAGIAAELSAEWAWHGEQVTPAELALQPQGPNAQTGWDEHVLLRNGQPIAFTDGPLAA